MVTGFRANGVDLDDVFDPYVEGTKPALTGYKAGTQDLRDRFAPLAYGTQAVATGYKVNGADLNTLFAKKGTAVYAKIVATPGYSGASYADIKWVTSGSITCGITFTIKADGTWLMDKVYNAGGASGNWFTPTTAGVGAGYSVRFTITKTFGDTADIVNPAPTFQTISTDRTLSVKLTATFNTTKYCTYSVRVEIKNNATGLVVSNHTFDIEVSAESSA